MGAVTLAPGINAIRPATVRIRGLVRRTPLLAAAPTKEQPQAARGLLLKLKALQATIILQVARRGQCAARPALGAVAAGT
jgi:hypothetical protein